MFNRIISFWNEQSDETKKHFIELKGIAEMPGQDFEIGQMLKEDQADIDLTKREAYFMPVEYNIVAIPDEVIF